MVDTTLELMMQHIANSLGQVSVIPKGPDRRVFHFIYNNKILVIITVIEDEKRNLNFVAKFEGSGKNPMGTSWGIYQRKDLETARKELALKIAKLI